jgi:hypothetical protein
MQLQHWFWQRWRRQQQQQQEEGQQQDYWKWLLFLQKLLSSQVAALRLQEVHGSEDGGHDSCISSWAGKPLLTVSLLTAQQATAAVQEEAQVPRWVSLWVVGAMTWLIDYSEPQGEQIQI